MESDKTNIDFIGQSHDFDEVRGMIADMLNPLYTVRYQGKALGERR